MSQMRPNFEKPPEAVSDRMKRIRSTDTSIERAMERLLDDLNMSHERQPRLPGRPDFRIMGTNILIFCDSAFWHGKREREISGEAFKKNKEFWVNKLTENRKRDQRTNRTLRRDGWSVHRFWDTDILKRPDKVRKRLERVYRGKKRLPDSD